MKVEFGQNGFSAEINENNYNANNIYPKTSVKSELNTLRNNLPLLFGILAIITSLFIFPAGIVFNAGAYIFGEAFESNLDKYIFAVCNIITIAVILSDVFSALSIHFYKKSTRTTIDTIALILAIIALIITTVSLFSTITIYLM